MPPCNDTMHATRLAIQPLSNVRACFRPQFVLATPKFVRSTLVADIERLQTTEPLSYNIHALAMSVWVTSGLFQLTPLFAACAYRKTIKMTRHGLNRKTRAFCALLSFRILGILVYQKACSQNRALGAKGSALLPNSIIIRR